MKDGARVTVLVGGPSAERAISLQTGDGVATALAERGFSVLRVEITEAMTWRLDGGAPSTLADALPRLLESDAVFPALHGPFGEDGTVQGFLETLGLPYVGSGVAASALAMDKAHARTVAAAAGLTVAPGVVGTDVEDVAARSAALARPLFVKPCRLGSSVGISRVGEEDDLRAALRLAFAEDARVLVEQGVGGTEVSVPVLEGEDGVVRALPVVLIAPKSQAFFDYEAKYTDGATDELVPAPIPAALETRLRALALRAHREFGCRGLSRTDFIVPDLERDDPPVFLELNTLPGLTAVSIFPRSAAVAGLSYGALCETLVRSAASA